MISTIIAENSLFFYVIKNFTKELLKFKIKTSYNLYDYYKEEETEGIRMILNQWRSLNSTISFDFFYLFWLVKKDLGDLDSRILTGDYSDDDFENAVMCEFHPGEPCSKCFKQWPVLGIDPVAPYMGNINLRSQKLDLVRKMKAKLRCPNCNGDFLEIVVVKIFGQNI